MDRSENTDLIKYEICMTWFNQYVLGWLSVQGFGCIKNTESCSYSMSTQTHVAELPVLITKIETFAKCNVKLSNSPTGNTILNLVSSICIGVG